MEKISPVYGQNDSTVLVIDSEQTLLDDSGLRSDDETVFFPPMSASASSHWDEPAELPTSGTMGSTSTGYLTGTNGFAGSNGSAAISRSSGLRSDNPLLSAARDALVFGSELSALARDAQIQAVRQQAVQQVRAFEARAQARGVAKPTLLAARYVICTFFDEQVMTSPWGGAHEWTQESLLSQFHGETYGGQGFFNILQRACDEPQRNLSLLELLFTLLSLGFQGKYRVDGDGQRKLEGLRDMVMALLQRGRDDPRLPLAIASEVPEQRHRYARPWLWRFLIAGAIAGLGGMQATLHWLLAEDTRQLAQRLESLAVPSTVWSSSEGVSGGLSPSLVGATVAPVSAPAVTAAPVRAPTSDIPVAAPPQF